MRQGCFRGLVGLLLLTAAACSPDTMSSNSGSRPAVTPAAGGGGGSTAPAAGNAAQGGGGSGGAPDLVIKPTPMPAGSPAKDDTDAGGADDCGAIRQMADAKPSPVDIVWVIDDSGSMADEQAAIQKNIAS